MGIFYELEGVTLRFSSEGEKFSGIRCAAQIVGRNIGATTERLCGSKESPGFPLNHGLRSGVKVLCRVS